MERTYGAPDRGYASLTDDDVITGEAVALDLPGASLATRIAGALIDVVVLAVVLAVTALTLMAATAPFSGAVQHIGTVLVIVVTLLVVPTTIETLSRGRSVGKLALGLRVIREDGGPTGFQHAFVRALIGVVEIYALSGIPAFFSAMLSSKGKRLGDYAAGTYVIRERATLVLPVPLMMPPELAGWAAHADIAAPDVGLALATRQVLRRWPELSPAAREATATSLAAQWSVLVAPQPPPHTPAVTFLIAVVAARREADLARLRREDALRARLSGAGTAGR